MSALCTGMDAQRGAAAPQRLDRDQTGLPAAR
jgi:hypothetical protein